MMRRVGSQTAGIVLLLAVALLTGVFLIYGPIVQPEAYHKFADRRSWLGIPNALDVLSNLPFLFVGAAGLRLLLVPEALRPEAFSDRFERGAFAVVFAALVLVAFGSSYYHWLPTTERLFWDRLPIAVALTGLLGIVIAERLDLGIGRRLFWPLVITGMISALSWRLTTDLRLYLIVQIFTLIALPLLLMLRPPRYTRTGDLVWMLLLYGAAKLCEVGDRAVWSALGGVLSGHTLKHLLAGAAVGMLLCHLRKRSLRYAAGSAVAGGSAQTKSR